MLNIEIRGIQFSNKGAELMLLAIIEQLDGELDDYQLILSPGLFSPYRKRARLGAFQKLSFRRGPIDLTGVLAKLPNKLLNLLKRYGIVTERDVDVILDASGFAYGEQWGVKSLANSAKEISRLQKKGKKYIFLPQAFGPFLSSDIRKLACEVFSKANLTFPRDTHSYQTLISLNSNVLGSNIKQAPDFTCLVEPELLTRCSNRKLICLIPNSKMFSKYNHDKAIDDEQKYLDFLIKVGLFFQTHGWRVVLLNHEGEKDQDICDEIAQALTIDEAIDIKANLSAIEIKAFIGSVDAVLSSRFHGCVSALSQGIPCLATSWSHKYQMLFQEYGLNENVLDFKKDETCLTQQLTQFSENLIAQQQQCLGHAKIVKNQTKDMWKKVFTELKSN